MGSVESEHPRLTNRKSFLKISNLWDHDTSTFTDGQTDGRTDRAVICGPLQILSQILRCRLVAALKHKNGQSKLKPFWDAQPMQSFKQRSDTVTVVILCGVEHVSVRMFSKFVEYSYSLYIYVYSPRRQIQRKEIEQIDRGQNLQSNKETFS